MFDVYVKETHPGMENNVQPKTLEERISFYNKYKNEYNMTIPALIDNMRNEFRKLYKPGPTGCILIDIRGIVVYTIQFIMGGGYSGIEKEVQKLLKETDDEFTFTNNDENRQQDIIFACQSGNNNFSITAPGQQYYNIEVYNLHGSRVFSENGCGSSVFDLGRLISSGKYLVRVLYDKERIVQPLIIKE